MSQRPDDSKGSSPFISPRLNAPNVGLYKAPLTKPRPRAPEKAEKPGGSNAKPKPKASSLFEALKAQNPEVDEADILAGADLQEKQRKYLQEKQQQKVLERLERRAEVRPGGHALGGRRRSSELGEPGAGPPAEGHHYPYREAGDDGAQRRSLEKRPSDNRRGSLDQRRSSLEVRRRSQDRRASLEAGEGPAPAVERSAASNKSLPRHGSGAPSDGHRSEDRRRSVEKRRSNDASEGEAPAAVAGGGSGWHASAQAAVHVSAAAQAQADAALRLAQDPKLQAAYDSYMASQLMSSLTEDELFAATSALGAVQKAYASNNGMRRPTSPAPGLAVERAGPSGSMQLPGESQNTVPPAGAGADARQKRRSSGASSSELLAEGLEERKRPVARSGHSGITRPGSTLAGPRDSKAEAGRGTPPPQHPGKAAPLLDSDSDDLGGPPLPMSAAAVAAALALVEVKPLADHIERDDEHLPPMLGPPPGAPPPPPPPPGAPGAAAADGGVGAADVTKDKKDGALARQDSNNSVGTYEEFGDLDQYSKLRRTCIKLCSNPDFEMVVTAIIFANCVTLCLYDPRKPESSGLNKKLFWAELAFNICFSIEMLLRVVSMGSLLAYIRRPWNQFDSFMVVAGYTVFVPGNSSAVNAIRALRALRPLRTITRFESLRGVIVCFLEAIPLLASVGGLLIFFVFLYAVAAVQLFPKTFHNTCLNPEGVPLNMGEDPDMFGCSGRGQCPANYTCTLLEHQHVVNVAGFDNTGLAMLSVWQALTLTGWVFMMYRTIDTYSLYVVIYYLTLVVIGAYFVLNLFLAVLKIKFAKAQTLFHNQLALQRGKARRNSIMTFMSRVQSKWTEYSSKRSQASSLNSRLSSAISSKMSSVASAGSPRISHDGKDEVGEGKPKRRSSKDKLGSEKAQARKRRGSADGSAYERRSADGFLPGSVAVEGGSDEVGGARARVEVSSGGAYPPASKVAGSLQASRDGTRDGTGVKTEWTHLEPPPRPVSPATAARGGARSALSVSPNSGTPSSRQLSRSSSRVSLIPAPGDPVEPAAAAALVPQAVATAAASTSPRTTAGQLADPSPRGQPKRMPSRLGRTAPGEGASGADAPQVGGPVAEASEIGLHQGSDTEALMALRHQGGGAEGSLSRHGTGFASGGAPRSSCVTPSAVLLGATSGCSSTGTESRRVTLDSQISAAAPVPALGMGSRLAALLPLFMTSAAAGPSTTPRWWDNAAWLPDGNDSDARSRQLTAAAGTGTRRSPGGGAVSGARAAPLLLQSSPSERANSLPSSNGWVGPGPVAEGVRFAGGDDEPGNESDHPSARAGHRAGGGGVRFGDEPSPGGPGDRGSDPTSPHPGAGEYTHRSSGGQGSANGEIMHSPHEGRTGSGLPGPHGGGGMGGRTTSADGLRPAASAELGERTYSAAPSSMGATNVAMTVMSPAEFDEFIADHPYAQRQYLRLQYRVRIIVNHNLFNQFFMLLIFLNTIFLSLEYHNQPHSLTKALAVSNLTLTVLFTIEMVLKLFGLGFWDYIRDGFNIFDALVVTISLLEIVLSSVAGLNAIRALRVLKALRVLRLFKLFRYMQSLRRIGEVLLSAASSFMAIATLLILFWMVFAIVGMHVFGDKDLDTFPWPNFSTFLFSLVATWNVLNLENWQNTMYAVIRQTDYASSLFFVMWIVIGRYIFLTLFLAVTLEAFEAKYDPNAVRMGANKTGISSMLGSLRSGLSSLRSGMSSVRSSLRGSGKGRSPPDSPRGGRKGGGDGGAKGTAAKQPEQGKSPAAQDGKDAAADGLPSNIFDTMSDSEVGRDSTSGFAEPVPPPSVLRPGIGYHADAAAAAAVDPDAPRVNLKKMYTIKEWIDTGNFEVLKDGGAKDGAAAPASADAAAATAAAAGTDMLLKAEQSTARSLKGEPSGTRSIGTADNAAAEGGKDKPARGMSYIDDSAAQSQASSDAAGGNSASGEAKGAAATSGTARPVAEGTETIRPDPTALPPSSSMGGGRSSLTGLRSTGGSPSPTWAGSGSKGRLESLNRNIRRSLEGFTADGEEEDGEEGDRTAGPRRHVLRGPSPLGGFAPGSISGAAPHGTAAAARSSASGMDGSELILTHGRSVRVGAGSPSNWGRSSIDLGASRSASRNQQLPDSAATAAAVHGRAIESSQGSRSHSLAVRQPANYVPPPSAPAPLRGGGLSPDLMRMAGSFGEDSSSDDDAAAAGKSSAAAAADATPAIVAAPVLATVGSLNAPGLRSTATTTVTTASAAEAQRQQQQQPQPVASSSASRQPLAAVDSSDDPLGSFMDPMQLAKPHPGPPPLTAVSGPAVAATSSIYSPSKPLPAPQSGALQPGALQPRLSLGLTTEPAGNNDVVMATFGDMSSVFAQGPAEPLQGPATAHPQPLPEHPSDASRLSFELEGVSALTAWSGHAANAHRARRSSMTAPRRHDAPVPVAAAEAQAGHQAGGASTAPASAEDDHLMALAGELAAALREQRAPQPAVAKEGDAVAAFHVPPLSAEASAIATGGAVGLLSASEATSLQPTPRLKELKAAAAAAGPHPHTERPSGVPALHLEGVGHGAPSALPHAAGAAAAAAAASSAFGSSGNKAAEGVPPVAALLQDSAHSMSASDRNRPGSGRPVGGTDIMLAESPSPRLPPGEQPSQNLDAVLPPGEALSRAATSNLEARDAAVKDAAAASGLLDDTLGERIRVAAAAARHNRGEHTQEEEDELIFGLEPIRGSKDASRRSSRDGAPRRPGSGRDQKAPSPGPGSGKGNDEDGEDAGRRGDKGPPLQRISESGSVASRADSADSRVSGGSRASSGGATGSADDDDKGDKKRKHFRKKRRASILIEGTGKAFWIWDEDHPWRENTYWLVTDRRFEYAMFVVILANCITLALENPYIVPGSPLDKALVWSNVGFTIIFAIEALLKSFAYTFVAYIKRVTNQVDFLIVVASILEIILLTITTSVGAVSALRVLRAFKPLRLLTRSAGMRLVFKSVTMSLMSMANVSVVCILFFLIFAILGVQLFSGRFYRCNDDTVAGQTECVGNFTDPLTNSTLERHWSNDFPNFDNTGNALLCCFITATLNGYTEIMVNAMSAPQEVGLQPKQFINPGAFFWFFGFIVVCAFTLLNLYVGVIFSQFSKIRMLSETGSAFLTTDQNEWAELTKMVFRLKPPEKSQLPTSRLRRFCYQLIHHKYFDIFILTIILINVGFLAATWYGEPVNYTRQKDLANIVFMAIFAAEAVLKIFALGWMGYIKVSWNKLDFVLLVMGLLDLVVSMLQSNFLRILRVFRVQKLIALVRVARFAQVVKSVKGIQSLFTTLVYSLPAFGNVGALIGLFFFMYAYVGTFLFGKVVEGETLNRHVNFHDFFQSLLVLTRVATGDNWTGIMFDCMVMPPDCSRHEGNCGSYLAIPYFLSFVLLISVILLNLFTAVIIETFEKTHEQEEWKLSPQALEDFVTLWSEYDDGSGTIQPRHLEELLLKLDPPLGLGPYADNKDVLRFVYDLDIPLVNGRVPFHKTAFELVKRCSQATMPEGAIKEQIDRLVDKFFHELAAQDEMLNFSVAITVMKVQRKWRTRMRAAKLRRKNQWRKDRRDAPTYPDVFINKVSVGEKYEAYRDAQREVAKTWEAAQLASNKKVDKAELARRMEPRWRFNPKYAPPSLVAATMEKTGLLGLGKRTINVNKLVGLFGLRGGLFGDGGDADKGVRQAPAEFPGGAYVSAPLLPLSSGAAGAEPGAVWPAASQPVPQVISPNAPEPSSPLPRLLRAITHTTGQLNFRTSYNGGGALGPADVTAVSGRVGAGTSISGDVGAGVGRQMPRRAATAQVPGFVEPEKERSVRGGVLAGLFRVANNNTSNSGAGAGGTDIASRSPSMLGAHPASPHNK
ncbi:hypothetical protein HYH02_006274 [Chlamydomonas schloesseri]|uniref:Ion transport domain-containing protein n=1 Tax=Chlamydomonas schloesseri TaxID=2026947 RepID=A0A836B6B7_9CHLO|nr:hypothetical protein HYH02_006274 [Chlamydomonas schloesseri]|eukprot:KAG2448926.1 hypothetical protein HYH02_006274 [Chlamydomonas schloesseri]